MAKRRPAARSSPSRIFVVEDHPTFREGLIQTLSAEPDFIICGQSDNAEEGLEKITRLKPDLALVDIGLPGRNGLALIKQIRAVNRYTHILVISMHDEAIYADRVLRAGGDGYIMKQEDPDEIVHAIRDVLCGRIYVSEEVLRGGKDSRKAPHPMSALTDLELEVLELLGSRRTNREIARRLEMTAANLAACYERLRLKLKLADHEALVRHAVHWVESESG